MWDDLDDAERMLDEIRDGYEEKRKHMQPGECPGCGAFRPDGKPPQIHEHGCPLDHPRQRLGSDQEGV